MITEVLYKLLSFNTKSVKFGRMRLRLWIASSLQQQILGLMHRPRILENQGMLFIFESDSSHGIWMHNMKFSIDCIWIDKGGRAVEVISDIEPCSSILNCPVYASGELSRYVLELRAGMAKKLRISRGTNLSSIIK